MMNVCSGFKNVEMSYNGFDFVEDFVGVFI